MAEAGRPTDLTDECFGKIKKSIIDGNDLKTTANVCGIEINTLYDWSSRNYLNISDKIEGWKRDRKIMLANKNIEEILAMDKGDRERLKVIQDTSKFVLETLDKDNYSKRSELTGKDGDNLIPRPILDVQQDNSNNQNTGTE